MKIWDLILVSRPLNLLIIILTMFLFRNYVIYAGSNTPEEAFTFVLLVSSVVLIAAGANVLNDLLDVRADEVNKSSKVKIGKSIPRQWAMRFVYATYVIGFILGGYACWSAGNLRLANIIVLAGGALALYSMRLKGIPLVGNLVVAAVIAITLMLTALFESNATGFHISDIPNLKNILLFYMGFAFLFNLIREIVKDIEDQKGDDLTGHKTLPLTIGVVKTKHLIVSLNVIALGVLAYLCTTLTAIEPWLYFMGILAIGGYQSFLVLKAKHKKDFTNASKLSKMIMVIGVISMIKIWEWV